MAKKNIDFNVYERSNPDSFVDWGKAASDITKTFETIRDDRQRRKDELDEAYRSRQEELNDIGEYENPTLQQRAIEAYDSASHQLANHQDLMKRGLIKPRDNTLFQHNVKTGFELFKKNATYYDAAFTEYANRTADDENALQERYLADNLKGFIDLNNTELSFNAETGQASFLKLEPAFITDESGKKVKNPKAGQPIKGQSMSLQDMTVFLKQRIEKFDVGASAIKMGEEVGNYIRAELQVNGIQVADYEREYSKMEQDLFDKTNKAGQKILTDKAQQMLANDQDRMDMLLRNVQYTDDGKKYKPGTRAEYEANGGDANKNNNIIVFEKDGTGLAQPSFSEEQEKKSTEYAKDQILSTLSSKETVSVQKIQYTPNPRSQQERANNKFILEVGQNVNKFLTATDALETDAAAQALVESMEGLDGLRKTKDGKVIIQKQGKKEQVIDIKGLNGDQAMRKIYKAVGGKVSYDTWKSAGGKAGGTVNYSDASAEGGQDVIGLPSFELEVGDETGNSGNFLEEKLGGDNVDGYIYNTGAGELESAVNEMLNTEGYKVDGLNITSTVSGSVSDGNMKVTLNINGEEVTLPYIDDVNKLGSRIDNTIKQTVQKINKGTGGGTNKKLNG